MRDDDARNGRRELLHVFEPVLVDIDDDVRRGELPDPVELDVLRVIARLDRELVQVIAGSRALDEDVVRAHRGLDRVPPVAADRGGDRTTLSIQTGVAKLDLAASRAFSLDRDGTGDSGLRDRAVATRLRASELIQPRRRGAASAARPSCG